MRGPLQAAMRRNTAVLLSREIDDRSQCRHKGALTTPTFALFATENCPAAPYQVQRR